MISQLRQPAPRTHLPLRQLALCLDCDECFGIGPETCPSCGSATWTTPSRFLAQASLARHPGHRDAVAKRHDDPPERVRQLIIVAVDRAHLHSSTITTMRGTVAPASPITVDVAVATTSGRCSVSSRRFGRQAVSTTSSRARAISPSVRLSQARDGRDRRARQSVAERPSGGYRGDLFCSARSLADAVEQGI